MSDETRAPFVFVPEGAAAPGELQGPGWVRVPATFLPRGVGRVTASGQPWPRDRLGRPWSRDRRGNPVCPLTELLPGGPVPGENSLDTPDPVAAFRATEAVFRDPAAAAGVVVQTAAAGTRSNAGESEPTGPVAPAVPDTDKQWLVPRQPRKQPVYDIYVGGAGDESKSQTVLNYARAQAVKGDHNVIYFPFDVNLPAASDPARAAALALQL